MTVPTPPSPPPLMQQPIRQRSVLLVTPDADLRHRLSQRLQHMRWHVLPAAGGAEAMGHLDEMTPEAMILDHWLPDLDAAEFAMSVAAMCPGTECLGIDGSSTSSGPKSARRHELLHALREAQDDTGDLPQESPVSSPLHGTAGLAPQKASSMVGDGAAWAHAPIVVPRPVAQVLPFEAQTVAPAPPREWPADLSAAAVQTPVEVQMHLPDLVGDDASMRSLASMVRLVAPHTTTVLIQGETGTGKELVAKAVHRLSSRAAKPFVVLNCAAIPEHLLEAELFGHTRGAFTGAVTARTGRIEAAHGGTLFLDEIGEMPLPLQAKLLRFLESGEIQRVGDNDVSRVDVRIVAATHQPLEANAEAKLFRLDLYHRLAVFPVDVPPLRSRRGDIPMLVEHFLRRLGATSPRKSIEADALAQLCAAPWPGNVRELGHALQRAVILASERPSIGLEHLRARAAVPGS